MSDKSTRKDILDALTRDSSLDGCDPDWRRSILARADPKIITDLKKRLSSKLPKEI